MFIVILKIMIQTKFQICLWYKNDRFTTLALLA